MSSSAQTSASDRIHALLDENSFVEVGAYVTARSTDFNMAAQETPADGVVTGYGTIQGGLVYVYSQDASVMGGSLGEMHAKKIAHVYELAMKMGAPVVGLVDCAGMRLQEATDALDGFGRLYLNQTLASGMVPQIAAIFGVCGGGMAVSAAMADFTFMEAEQAKLFVTAPNALDGALAEKKGAATAGFQSRESGMADFIGGEGDILEQIRTLVSILPSNNEDDMSYDECTDDLNRVCEELGNCAGDTSIALSQISDHQFFMEVKAGYARSMVTGFIRLNGTTVGCVANRTEVYGEDGAKSEEFDAVLTAEGCEKAVGFIGFCDAFNIPLLTLAHVKGYEATMGAERSIAKASARLTYAFANASIPKVTVVVGEAYGSAYLTMNSKSIGADVVYAWPEAAIGMMDASSAVKIMYDKEIGEASDSMALIQEKTAQYQALQTSAVAAARRGYVDDIIQAADTRKRVIAAFEMLFTKREGRPDKKHGTI